MKNALNWFEIPAADFDRARTFYGSLLGAELYVSDVANDRMAFFPADEGAIGGAIVSGDGSTPSREGTIVYLNGQPDLQQMLDRVESAGGSILVPKTMISKEYGFFAHFLDTEGNRVGLHSME